MSPAAAEVRAGLKRVQPGHNSIGVWTQNQVLGMTKERIGFSRTTSFTGAPSKKGLRVIHNAAPPKHRSRDVNRKKTIPCVHACEPWRHMHVFVGKSKLLYTRTVKDKETLLGQASASSIYAIVNLGMAAGTKLHSSDSDATAAQPGQGQAGDPPIIPVPRTC